MKPRTTVVNKRLAPYDVDITRPSTWGNPWSHKANHHVQHVVGSKTAAIAEFEKWIRSQPELMARARKELRGKVLGCYCRQPGPCHGHVLARIADSKERAPHKRATSEDLRAPLEGATRDSSVQLEIAPLPSEPPSSSITRAPSRRERAPTRKQMIRDAALRAGYDPQAHGAMCLICPLAGNTIVPPNGSYEGRPVRLALVGEGPGRKEEIQGRGFVGMSGVFLDGLLRKHGIDRREATVSNAALCRGERDKDNERAGVCCAPRLLRELKELPKDAVIVALGKAAALSVLGTKSIMHARGFVWTAREIDPAHVAAQHRAVLKAKSKGAAKTFLQELELKAAIVEGRAALAGRKVFPTIHPAFVLRSDTWAPILESDLDRVGRWLSGALKPRHLLDYKPKFELVRTSEEIRAAFDHLGSVIAVDIETDGVDPMQAKILCVGVSDGKHTVVVVHPDADPEKPAPPWDRKRQAPELSALFARVSQIGMHNGYNFDQIALRRDGVEIPIEKLEDTLIAHHAFASHFPQRLAHVASVFVDVGPWKITFKRGKGEAEKGLPPQKLPMGELVTYNACDAVVQARVWLAMQVDLESERPVYAHDKELAVMCQAMQVAGIRMDVARRDLLTRAIRRKAARLKLTMARIIKKEEFHPMRLAEVRHALFVTLRAPPIMPTESGVPSTSSATLEVLKTSPARYGRFSKALLAWRGAVKVKSTYLDAIPLWKNDRFHVSWKSFGTVSGRLSSRLQSVPRLEINKKKQKIVETRVREVYVPRTGCSFVYFDVCFATGTMIDGPAGAKPIEKMRVGDVVYTYRKETERPAIGKVTQHIRMGRKAVVKVTLDNGKAIRCTPDHKWLVCPWGSGGIPVERTADSLQPGDRLLALRKQLNHKVVSVKKDGYADVWSIAVDPDHNYALAAGVFVCNCQAEMRFAANLSNDANFINTCKGDVHSGNAKILFPDEVDLIENDVKGRGAPYRTVSKSMGFAVCYLAEAETIFQKLRAQGFDVHLGDVVTMLDRMRAGYPDYYKFVAANIAFVAKHGYFRTPIIGRIRWLGWHAPPTEIANTPIQSGIADIMNIRSVTISKRLLPGVRPVAQIHDAGIYETPHRHVEKMKDLLKEVWAEPVVLPSNGRSFVLPIDLKTGGRWSDF